MDFSALAIIWIVILVLEQVVGHKKKKPPAPTETGNADFDIPNLANDPNFPGEDVQVFVDEQKAAEVREIGFTELYRQRQAEARAEKNIQPKVSSTTQNKNYNLKLNLTADSAMNAIVLSEILGKPKALRRR